MFETSIYEEENVEKSAISFKKQAVHKFSIVIPCYNESKTIQGLIQNLKNLELPNYEIIIVDDGSTDNSVELLSNYQDINCIIHEKNEGYGKSLIDGIMKSTGDLIITIDSDGQHDPRDIINLCKPVIENQADIVVGSRYKGNYFYRIPFVNRAGEAFLEIMMLILFGKRVTNNQGGFRVFHRRTISIFNDFKFMGMAFTTELLIKSFLKGYRVVEKPINLHDRPVGKSRVRKIPLLMNLLLCMFYYFFKDFERFLKKNNR